MKKTINLLILIKFVFLCSINKINAMHDNNLEKLQKGLIESEKKPLFELKEEIKKIIKMLIIDRNLSGENIFTKYSISFFGLAVEDIEYNIKNNIEIYRSISLSDTLFLILRNKNKQQEEGFPWKIEFNYLDLWARPSRLNIPNGLFNEFGSWLKSWFKSSCSVNHNGMIYDLKLVILPEFMAEKIIFREWFKIILLQAVQYYQWLSFLKNNIKLLIKSLKNKTDINKILSKFKEEINFNELFLEIINNIEKQLMLNNCDKNKIEKIICEMKKKLLFNFNEFDPLVENLLKELSFYLKRLHRKEKNKILNESINNKNYFLSNEKDDLFNSLKSNEFNKKYVKTYFKIEGYRTFKFIGDLFENFRRPPLRVIQEYLKEPNEDTHSKTLNQITEKVCELNNKNPIPFKKIPYKNYKKIEKI